MSNPFAHAAASAATATVGRRHAASALRRARATVQVTDGKRPRPLPGARRPSATPAAPEIRRAYRRLARQHHPDRNPQPDGPERFRRARRGLRGPQRPRPTRPLRPRPPAASASDRPAPIRPASQRPCAGCSSCHRAKRSSPPPVADAHRPHGRSRSCCRPALRDGDQITVLARRPRHVVLTVRVLHTEKT